MDRIRSEVRANRAFLRRAVRYLIHETGIRQFLDIGTGIPNDDNVHAVALQETPDARVVYVDKDPVVLAHAHILLTDAPAGSTTYIQADFRDPEDIVDRASALIDFTQPVAVMLVGLLHHFRDADAYRRDRRKDLELQRRGYLVVRVLADDVVRRLEEILETILGLVAHRSRPAPRS